MKVCMLALQAVVLTTMEQAKCFWLDTHHLTSEEETMICFCVPNARPMHGFSPNLQHIFTQNGSHLISFGILSFNNCYHGNTLNFWGVLNMYTSLNLKPMHRFSPDLHHTFTPRGFTVCYLLVAVLQQLLP